MHKQLVTGIIITSLLIGAAGCAPQSTNTNQNTPVGQSETETRSSSLKALIASGQSLECTFNREEDGTAQQGTVYLDNERMRGDFTIASAATGSFEMHMIQDADWLYSWGGPQGENKGIKMSRAKIETDSSVKPNNESIDLDEALDFNCKPWRVDSSLLTPPSTVVFTEFTTPTQPTTQSSSSMCASCDQVPTESREQCRRALGC